MSVLQDEQQFKGPREHHPELVSSSLVSKDVMMKKALGFDCKLGVYYSWCS